MALTKDTLSAFEDYKTTLGTDEVIVGQEKVVFAEILPDLTIKEYVEPTIQFTKWEKEESLTLSYPTDIGFSDKTLVDGKLKLSAGKEEFYFRQHDTDTMKFGLILNEIPDKSKIVTIDGVEYYQWQFKITGNDRLIQIKRPPLIKDNGNGTKTFSSDGGVGEHENSQRFYREVTSLESIHDKQVLVKHIEHGFTFLRPKFIDSKGEWVWADLEIRGFEYIVTCPQEFLDKAIYPVKANDSVTYQQGTSGYTGCIDVGILGNDPDTNQETVNYLPITTYGYNWRSLISFDLSAISAGATFTAVTIQGNFSYVDAYGNNPVGAYRVLKTWTEAGATYNDWIAPNSEWGTAGCDNASDAGTFNSGDGSGYDRWSTPDDTETFSGGDTGWHTWGSTVALVASAQAQFDAANYCGWLFRNANTNNLDISCWSSEYTTVASRPKITITYTPSGTNVTVQPTIARVSVITQTPVISAVKTVIVSSTLASISATTQSVTVSAVKNVTVSATLVSVTATCFTPTVETAGNVTVSPDLASASLTLASPTISAIKNVTVSPALASATVTVFTPTVDITGSVTVSPELISIKVNPVSPSVSAVSNATVTPGTASITAICQDATVSTVTNANISVDKVNVTFRTFDPVVSVVAHKTIGVSLLVMSVRLFSPTIDTPEPPSEAGDVILLESKIEKTILHKSQIEKTILHKSQIEKTILHSSPLH